MEFNGWAVLDWICVFAAVLSLAVNVFAVVLLVQFFRRIDRTSFYKWSRWLSRLVLVSAMAWLGTTAWGIATAIYGASGFDPSLKATLIASGIAETVNCLACLVIFLLLPTIILIVVHKRSAP